MGIYEGCQFHIEKCEKVKLTFQRVALSLQLFHFFFLLYTDLLCSLIPGQTMVILEHFARNFYLFGLGTQVMSP